MMELARQRDVPVEPTDFVRCAKPPRKSKKEVFCREAKNLGPEALPVRQKSSRTATSSDLGVNSTQNVENDHAD